MDHNTTLRMLRETLIALKAVRVMDLPPIVWEDVNSAAASTLQALMDLTRETADEEYEAYVPPVLTELCNRCGMAPCLNLYEEQCGECLDMVCDECGEEVGPEVTSCDRCSEARDADEIDHQLSLGWNA